jgi:hypothetical protein
MSIHVYKPGETHEVDGLKCEIITCEIGDYADHKAAGCVDNVKELYPELFPVSDPEEIPVSDPEEIPVSDPEEIPVEVQIDLVDAVNAPEFLTQNIPVDKADKSKKK